MLLSIDTGSYNDKRYGKPYIGLVSRATGDVLKWGKWIGEDGEEGILEINVEPGDIIIKGQKDNRKPYSQIDYGIIQENGEIEYMTKAKAVKTARALAAEKEKNAD